MPCKVINPVGDLDKLDRFSRKDALAVLTIKDALEGKRIFFGAENLDTSNRNDRRVIMWRAEDALRDPLAWWVTRERTSPSGERVGTCASWE